MLSLGGGSVRRFAWNSWNRLIYPGCSHSNVEYIIQYIHVINVPMIIYVNVQVIHILEHTKHLPKKRAPLGVLAGVVGGLAICPWLDLTMSGPSYQRNASACFLHRQWLQAANPLVSFVTLQCRFSVIMNHFI